MTAPRSLAVPALAALLLAAACQAPPPRAAVHTAWGVVRADDTATARSIAAQLAGSHPRVQRMLPGTRAEPAELWVQDVPAFYRWWPHDDADGFYVPGTRRIHLRADAAHGTLEHELVHLLLDEPWSALPAAVEEGLCDLVAAELVPESAPVVRATRAAGASLALGELAFVVAYDESTSLTRITADPIDPLMALAAHRDERASAARDRELRGIGFLVADRIVRRHGYDGLYALCRRARALGHEKVPAWALARAAGLDGPFELWRAAIGELVGPAELRRLAQRFEARLAHGLADDAARLGGAGRGDDADGFFEQSAPRLRLWGDDDEFPLAELWSLRAAFDAARALDAGR